MSPSPLRAASAEKTASQGDASQAETPNGAEPDVVPGTEADEPANSEPRRSAMVCTGTTLDDLDDEIAA